MNVKMLPLLALLLAARQVYMFSMGAPDSACQGKEFASYEITNKNNKIQNIEQLSSLLPESSESNVL